MLSKRGGAHVGSSHASWPFASMDCDARQLQVSCLGTYTFKPEQVWAIEPYGWIPIIASGVRIRHNRLDYPERVVFFHFGTAEGLRAEIAASGFRANGAKVDRPSGMAWRWSFLIAVIVLWNLLFLADMGFELFPGPEHRPGPFALVAFVCSFLVSASVYFLPAMQRFALRPGRDVGEVKGTLVLFMLVSGILSVAFGATSLAA